MRSVGFLRPVLDNPMTHPVFAPMALWVGPDVTVRPAGDPMVADTAPQTQLQPGEPQIGTGLIVGLSVASLISGAIIGVRPMPPPT